MTILIKPISAADEPLLWDFLYLAVYLPPGQAPYPREILDLPEIRRYLLGWGMPHDRGLIAWEDDPTKGEQHRVLIGAAWLRLLTGFDKGFGYWNDETPELCIAVVPDRRGRGVGALLLRRLLEEASACYPAVSLSVDEGNPARRLYERCGFRTVGEKDGSLIMVRKFLK